MESVKHRAERRAEGNGMSPAFSTRAEEGLSKREYISALILASNPPKSDDESGKPGDYRRAAAVAVGLAEALLLELAQE